MNTFGTNHDAKPILRTHYKVTVERISGHGDLQASLLVNVMCGLDLRSLASGLTVDFCHCGQSVRLYSGTVNKSVTDTVRNSCDEIVCKPHDETNCGPQIKSIEMQSQQISFVTAPTVSELQKLRFSSLTLPEKIFIKSRGRPTPKITSHLFSVSRNKTYIRNFNPIWYKRKTWLCGCEVKNALFCFPCLLYGGDPKWIRDGFANVKHFSAVFIEHEISLKHIENEMSLLLLKTVNNKSEINRYFEHNQKVAKNREIISKIINCMLLYGSFEIHLNTQIEKRNLANPNLFKELVNFLYKLDTELSYHLVNNKPFIGKITAIENKILDCIFQVYQNKIIEDIVEASFVTVIVEDLTDAPGIPHLVIVLRYLLKCEEFEHFWGFFSPESQTVDALSECILKQLNIILQKNEHKLIAQTFDGVNFMNCKKAVQTKIKEVYHNVHFVHCYNHELDAIIKNAASVTLGSRIFFANIMTISTFFSHLDHMKIFHKHVFANVTNSTCSQNIFIVDTFHLYTIFRVDDCIEELKGCLEEIQTSSNVFQTISEAAGILMLLNSENFLLWLEFFHLIVPHIETLYFTIQSNDVDICQIHEHISIFKTTILKIIKYFKDLPNAPFAEIKAVVDCIFAEIEVRYSFINHLVAAVLFKKKNFAGFKTSHPAEQIALVTEAFHMINKEKFDNELRVFYQRFNGHCFNTLTSLLTFIINNNLDTVLCEITKLIKIILTIPMPSSEPGCCLSTLKGIKHFMKDILSRDNLNALAVISTENKFLNTHSDIKEKVLVLFSKQFYWGVNFVFK